MAAQFSVQAFAKVGINETFPLVAQPCSLVVRAIRIPPDAAEVVVAGATVSFMNTSNGGLVCDLVWANDSREFSQSDFVVQADAPGENKLGMPIAAYSQPFRLYRRWSATVSHTNCIQPLPSINLRLPKDAPLLRWLVFQCYSVDPGRVSSHIGVSFYGTPSEEIIDEQGLRD